MKKEIKSGRKSGSNNKFSKQSKEKISEIFEKDFESIHNHFRYVDYDKKFTQLKPIAKILCSGNDEVSQKTKQIIFDSLKDEFKKLKFYINQLPADKRAVELRQYLGYLGKQQIEDILLNVRK